MLLSDGKWHRLAADASSVIRGNWASILAGFSKARTPPICQLFRSAAGAWILELAVTLLQFARECSDVMFQLNLEYAT